MTVVEQYTKYVKNLPVLLRRFSELKITHQWQQVLTSITTGIMGTGITFSSVIADYTLNGDGSISLINRAYNSDLSPIYIKGVCTCQDKTIPTCRIVSFDNLLCFSI